jgi:hypothetical protein
MIQSGFTNSWNFLWVTDEFHCDFGFTQINFAKSLCNIHNYFIEIMKPTKIQSKYSTKSGQTEPHMKLGSFFWNSTTARGYMEI